MVVLTTLHTLKTVKNQFTFIKIVLPNKSLKHARFDYSVQNLAQTCYEAFLKDLIYSINRAALTSIIDFEFM